MTDRGKEMPDGVPPETPEPPQASTAPLFSPTHLRAINERLTLAALQAHEQAEESADRYRDLVEGLDAIVWEADAEPWQFTFVSQRAEALLGYAITRWLGERDFWVGLIHPDDREGALTVCQTATVPPRDFRAEFRMVGADGRIVWLAMLARPRLNARARPQFRGLLIDVGDAVRAEALQKLVTERTTALVTHQARLRALAAELTLTEHRARTELAEELHDHLAQLLALGRMKVGQAQKVRGVACQAFIQQAEAALDEALRYTRTLVADLTPPVLHQFGLPAALQWLAEHMQRYDLTVTVEGLNIPALALREDQAVLLFQSVRELLINIAKHAETGQATVSVQAEKGSIRVVVRDEGRGFEVASASNPSPSTSSRFGLFSIRERMTCLGGSFEVESTVGRGSSATLLLPLAATTASKSLREVWIDQSAPSPPLFRPVEGPHDSSRDLTQPTINVLLVDDHAMVRQGLRGVVDSYPHLHVVGEASDGIEALEAVRRLKPEVVVMDINMPRMNGIEATQRIKAEFPEMAIIGLSVHQATEIFAEAMKKAGICRYLTKDSAAEALCQAIEEAVTARH